MHRYTAGPYPCRLLTCRSKRRSLAHRRVARVQAMAKALSRAAVACELVACTLQLPNVRVRGYGRSERGFRCLPPALYSVPRFGCSCTGLNSGPAPRCCSLRSVQASRRHELVSGNIPRAWPRSLTTTSLAAACQHQQHQHICSTNPRSLPTPHRRLMSSGMALGSS